MDLVRFVSHEESDNNLVLLDKSKWMGRDGNGFDTKLYNKRLANNYIAMVLLVNVLDHVIYMTYVYTLCDICI